MREAAEVSRALAAGQRALQAGDHAGAVEAYERALQAGADSADLWFNLGHAHFRAGAPGPAAWAWERSLRREPADEAARSNLELVRAQAGSRGEAPFAARLGARVDADAAAWVLLGAWSLCWLLVITRRWTSGWARQLLAIGAALALVVAGLAGVATWASWQVRQAGWSVLLQDAPVYEEAGGASPLFTLPATELVRAGAREGTRLYVETAGGMGGWVDAAEVAAIDEGG